MNSYLKKAVFSLILVAAVFTVIVTLTNAFGMLQAVKLEFFLLASSFFLASVFIWIISWAYLLRRREDIPYSKIIIVGFSAVFGSLTPIQIGAEALRSFKLKQHFNVRYTHSVSASMVVKGTKFLLLALFASFILFFYLIESLAGLDPLIFFGFSSGLFVVVLATLLFLLPLNKRLGGKIARVFHRLSRFQSLFGRLGKFFEYYSTYLANTKKRDYLCILVLSFFSWLFEFLALQYSFLALEIALPFQSALLLLILVSVLERTPFLPRGIGLVELVGYNYLAFPLFSKVPGLTASVIGAVRVVYGVVRLVIPTVLSILFNVAFRKA